MLILCSNSHYLPFSLSVWELYYLTLPVSCTYTMAILQWMNIIELYLTVVSLHRLLSNERPWLNKFIIQLKDHNNIWCFLNVVLVDFTKLSDFSLQKMQLHVAWVLKKQILCVLYHSPAVLSTVHCTTVCRYCDGK